MMCELPSEELLLSAVPVPPAGPTKESVPEGKLIDFLTGRQVNDTPEEYVRQNLERALVRQYGYAKAHCLPEVPIKVGSSRKRVDVIVWPDGDERTQENAYILVECKKAGTSPKGKVDGVDQLKSYMAACLNARYGLWTNGDDRFCFAKRTTAKGGHAFEEIVEIPAFGQTEEDAQRPKRKDLQAATADNLMFAFRRCHNYIAGSEGMQKQEAFWELLKMIFCKIEDERSSTLSFYVLPSELESGTTAAPAKARTQKIFKDKVVKKYPSIFKAPEAQVIDLKPLTMAYVVSQLQSFSLLSTNVDVKGKAYEEVVGSNLRGDRGEFFTPRNACQMAVRMIDPRPGERMLDPACGTGGFLITAMNHALSLLEEAERAQWDNPAEGSDYERQELWRKRDEYLRECVVGLDLNPALVRAAKMNMVMNNDGSGGLEQANSLANPHTLSPEARKLAPLGSFDIIFTNPPFGANITIDDEEVLSQYELATVWDLGNDGRWSKRLDKEGNPVLQKSQPPEILFIERCVQLMKPGTGRMAMVIPNGILNNPALEYVRQWILDNTQLLAVVDMARELFQPKNDTQTSMVLMRRLSDDELSLARASKLDYACFMAVTERIGRDKRGQTIYRRNAEGEDLLIARQEREVAPATDAPSTQQAIVEVLERVIDDELPEAAEAYLAWVAGQVDR
jgi:type I restriction enzyme M protein